MFLKALVIHQLVTGKPGCIRSFKWRSQLHRGGVAQEQCLSTFVEDLFQLHELPERMKRKTTSSCSRKAKAEKSKVLLVYEQLWHIQCIKDYN